jgi:ribose 5-phosphate isomerase B
MIYLASDHRGFNMKEKLKSWLHEQKYEFKDMGPSSLDPEDDYPDYVARAAREVGKDPSNSKAIVMGRSGQGEAMMANRFRGVRATVYYGGVQEIIALSRIDNDSNLLSLGVGFLKEQEVEDAVRQWLTTEFTNEVRHVRRINKLDQL